MNQTALASAELFDPKINRFIPGASLHQARSSHTAALLSNGDVLIAGGADGTGHTPIASAEVYKTDTGSFSPTGNLIEARIQLPDSTSLLDGRVLIVGGAASAEIYDPKLGSFRTVEGSLDTARYHSAALQLMDGSTRIFGGFDSKGVSTAKTWIYRPR